MTGLLIAVGAVNSQGRDFRPDRADDLRQLVRNQVARNQELRASQAQLRDEMVGLASAQVQDQELQGQVQLAAEQASVTAVSGVGVRVTLDDAHLEVAPAGVSDDALVVHQQDIQAVTNALWSGGAEAMSIQGQRVIATTGIKCVGNSVVLQGVPYAPPYVIEAIGEPERLLAALDASPAVSIYRQYVEAYGLGYSAEAVEQLELPGYSGPLLPGQAQAQS